jgi:hypothetical protein
MPRAVSLFLPAWSSDRLRKIFPKLTDDGVGFTASRSHSGRAALSHKPGSLALSIKTSKDDREISSAVCGRLTQSYTWRELAELDRLTQPALETKRSAWHFGVMTICGHARLVHTYSCIF